MNEFIKELMDEKKIKIEGVYTRLDKILNITTVFFNSNIISFDSSNDAFIMNEVIKGYSLNIRGLVDSGMINVCVVNMKGLVVAMFTFDVITKKIDKQYSKIDNFEDELEFVNYFAKLSDTCDHINDLVEECSEEKSSDEDCNDTLEEDISTQK